MGELFLFVHELHTKKKVQSKLEKLKNAKKVPMAHLTPDVSPPTDRGHRAQHNGGTLSLRPSELDLARPSQICQSMPRLQLKATPTKCWLAPFRSTTATFFSMRAALRNQFSLG